MAALLEQFPLSVVWQAALKNELGEPYLVQLAAFLEQQKAAGKTCFPADNDVFNALNSTAPEQVKVVIIGQDPYHGPGQAHGLSFSVAPGVKPPPSLKNIYKELQADCQLGEVDLRQGNLQSWADQGVLLLNAVLTVQAGKAASHQGRGWERFTDAIIAHVAAVQPAVVFILWGAYAQKKARIVDAKKHLLLRSVHPSPLSAYRGFLGSQPFSQANRFLEDHGRAPIAWAKVVE